MKEPTKTMHIYFICKFQKAQEERSKNKTELKQQNKDKTIKSRKRWKLQALHFEVHDFG
jgi:hypothetical protein